MSINRVKESLSTRRTALVLGSVVVIVVGGLLAYREASTSAHAGTCQDLAYAKAAAAKGSHECDSEHAVNQTKPDPSAAEPTPGPAEIAATGIVETDEAPFPSMQFLGVNRWQDYIDGNLVMVLFGSSGSDRNQGLVAVITEKPGGQTTTRWARTVARDGALRVVSVDARHRMRVLSAKGRAYTFDLTSDTLCLGVC